MKIYDLSQPIYHNCPGWPTYDQTILSWDFRIVTHGFNGETLTINMHTGTHIDVPYHFFMDGKKTDDFPISFFSGPCVVLNLSKVVKPDTPIAPEDVEPYLDQIKPGDIALLYTGYGQKRGYNREYLYEYPYLGGPAAELLVKAGIRGVAIDALSLGGMGLDANGNEKGRPCHEAVLSHETFIVEEIIVPEVLLDGKKRFFAAFPLYVKGCGGAVARAVMMEF